MADVQIAMLGGFAVTVDGRPIGARGWTRRTAAALVKVLALAPDRRLHREQVIDLLWPDDGIEQATPKLHKAAHFARRILDAENSVVLRGDNVVLLPDAGTTVDVARFEDLSRQALADNDVAVAHEALALYDGELLPADRYEPWAVERREHLRLRHLDLLRLARRWDTVVELDPSDEVAHLALMRRHAANGDRHAALRQFERIERSLRELGVAPGPEALALRDRLLVDHDRAPRGIDELVGRGKEQSIAEHALVDAAAGQSRVLLVSGAAGIGKSSLLGVVTTRAKELGFRVGHGTAARVEAPWAYAPVVEALADIVRHHPDLLDGLPDHHRKRIDQALSGSELSEADARSQQPLFVAAAELVRVASATSGIVLVIDDLQDADHASLRLVHYLARSTRDSRVCMVLAHRPAPMTATLAEVRESLVERHGATVVPLGPLDRQGIAELARRQLPDAAEDVLERISALSRGLPFTVNNLARRMRAEPQWLQTLDASMVDGVSPTTRDALQRVAVAGSSFDTDEFVALSGLAETEAFARLDDSLAADIVEPTISGYRFRHDASRDALLDEVPPHRRRSMHRDAAARLIALGASPARIGHHLPHPGSTAWDMPHLLDAANTVAAVGAYRDALALVNAVKLHVTGPHRATAVPRHEDVRDAVGDPRAGRTDRGGALDEADPSHVRPLRARLVRRAMASGYLPAAALGGSGTDAHVSGEVLASGEPGLDAVERVAARKLRDDKSTSTVGAGTTPASAAPRCA